MAKMPLIYCLPEFLLPQTLKKNKYQIQLLINVNTSLVELTFLSKIETAISHSTNEATLSEKFLPEPLGAEKEPIRLVS